LHFLRKRELILNDVHARLSLTFAKYDQAGVNLLILQEKITRLNCHNSNYQRTLIID